MNFSRGSLWDFLQELILWIHTGVIPKVPIESLIQKVLLLEIRPGFLLGDSAVHYISSVHLIFGNSAKNSLQRFRQEFSFETPPLGDFSGVSPGFPMPSAYGSIEDFFLGIPLGITSRKKHQEFLLEIPAGVRPGVFSTGSFEYYYRRPIWRFLQKLHRGKLIS